MGRRTLSSGNPTSLASRSSFSPPFYDDGPADLGSLPLLQISVLAAGPACVAPLRSPRWALRRGAARQLSCSCCYYLPLPPVLRLRGCFSVFFFSTSLAALIASVSLSLYAVCTKTRGNVAASLASRRGVFRRSRKNRRRSLVDCAKTHRGRSVKAPFLL